MARRISVWCCICFLCAVIAGYWRAESARAQEKVAKDAVKAAKSAQAAVTKADAAATSKSGGTHKVEKGPFKIEVSLKGVIEAKETSEIIFRPEVWSMLEVAKAVEHGAQVKKGDVILALDLKKIDEAIADTELTQTIAELSIKQAQEELAFNEKSAPLDLAAMERSRKAAEEDLQFFLKTDRPLSEKTAQFSMKSMTDMLEYEKEELRQLEKMYKADDLTEETEEIILKRQRNSVEQYTFMLERSKIYNDRLLKVEIPRREDLVKESARKAIHSYEQIRSTMPIAMNKKRLDLVKMTRDQQKAEERLAKLRKDRDMMIVKSPSDGTVYYGGATRGQWSSMVSSDRLREGSNVRPNEIVMTVVKSRPVQVRAVVPEGELQNLKEDLTGPVTMAGYPDLKLSAKLEAVSAIPVTPGNFDAKLAVELGPTASVVMPGMACSVKLTAYNVKDAISVPSSAVFEDEADSEQKHVFIKKKEGEPVKQAVKAGKKSGTKTEILEGLKEGDEILLEKPEKKTKE